MVILPDYQNLGIGGKVNDFMGEWYLRQGLRLMIRTSHIRLINHYKNSTLWKPTTTNNKASGHVSVVRHETTHEQEKNFNRVCGSYEYVGKDFIKEHLQIYIDNYKDSLSRLKEILLSLKEKFYIEFFHGMAGKEDDIDRLCKEIQISNATLKIKRNGVINIKKTLQNKTIINTEDELLSYLNKLKIK